MDVHESIKLPHFYFVQTMVKTFRRSEMSWLVVTLLGITHIAVKADHPLWINEIEDMPDIEGTITRSTDTSYRLPQNVIPLEYDIYIDLYFAERTDRPFSYDGRVTTIIQAIEQNVTTIVTHANFIFTEARLTSDSGDQIRFELHEDHQRHFLHFNLDQPLEIGRNYSLYIGYSKDMNEGPLKRGIWRGWYIDDNGVERIYAATHFQPYSARQAFPCWDEPLFKAVFKIHLSRPFNYNATFSNTRIESSENIGNNRIRDNFLATPKMSSYLVTFLVSETFRVIASDTSFDPPIRIIGRSNTARLGQHALQLSVGMTKYFDEYFKIPYSTLHPNLSNDHIASPDWASAGTENWGMVSYREIHLIIDPRETIMSVEHYTATLVSHELAHKWFGNLITCYWWSNTWINEGFASYFGYIAAHQVFPQYDLDQHFNSRYLQGSLSFDSGVSTVPLNHDVNTPAQVTSHFGTISYSKGAAFLRMLSDMITPETFRKACQYFLQDNLYKAVDQHDLFKAFERAVQEDGTMDGYDISFSEYYRIWVNEPGYPLLTVEVDHKSGIVALSQERFFLNPNATATEQSYPIPINYITKSSNLTAGLKPLYIMNTRESQFLKTPVREWIILNVNQHGLYRVTYDEDTWNLISEALLISPAAINDLNRAQIVDDVFALMRSEKMTYSFGFKILRFLRYETNYHVWRPAISGYSFLRNRLRHLHQARATFESFILSYMETVIRAVGYEPRPMESVTDSLLRQEVLHFACTLGHVGCKIDSEERFTNMRRDSRYWVDPRIRRHVYEVGVKEGGRDAFEFLLNRYRTSNMANDQLEMLRGLASTSIPVVLTRYLEMTLDQTVRHHDKVTAFNYALQADRHADIVLEFVKDNIDVIRTAYSANSPANPVHTILSNLASYLDEYGLEKYEEWLLNTQSNTAQFNSARSAINTARNNMAWGRENAEMILAAARDGASTFIVSSILLIAMSLLVTVA